MADLIDLTGHRFGKLTVVAPCEKKKGRSERFWVCRCDCGKTSKPISGYNLRKGFTRSCGCIRVERAEKSIRSKFHGMCKTHIYKVWEGAKSRCFNPKVPNYKNYGGRGITMCDEWKNCFQAFHNYVSKLPHVNEPGYTLDRIDNDGNYEPGNVRWASAKDQINNRRKRRTSK